MQQIYAQGLWGSTQTDFYSGEGSHHTDIVNPFINQIVRFLSSFSEPLSVCDLGCGDFNIGKQLVPYTRKYLAIDIVPELIERNREMYKDKRLSFDCLDISRDKLPKADCAIIRQVLQHLSNAEILRIIPQLYQYSHVILTEHIPEGNFEPNKNIISGQGIRLKKKSGVDIHKAPFYLKSKDSKTLLTQNSESYKGILVTHLISL